LGQWAVLVGVPDAAIELRVGGEAFLDPGHADEQRAKVVAVETVA
jgi:hypothetical protein